MWVMDSYWLEDTKSLMVYVIEKKRSHEKARGSFSIRNLILDIDEPCIEKRDEESDQETWCTIQEKIQRNKLASRCH